MFWEKTMMMVSWFWMITTASTVGAFFQTEQILLFFIVFLLLPAPPDPAPPLDALRRPSDLLPPTSRSIGPSSTPGCTTPPLRPLFPSRGSLPPASSPSPSSSTSSSSPARHAHIFARFDVLRPMGFCLVIDAGPAGSRIHVFELLNEGWIPFVGLDGKGSVSMKVRSGLQEFAAEPKRARGSLDGLLEFTRERIPKAEWKATTKISLIDSGVIRGLKVEVIREL